MASASGLSSISNVSSTAALTLNNLQSVPTITINTNAVASTFNFSNSALSSATDSMTINVQGMTGAAGNDIVLTRASGATNDLESVTINSSIVANVIETLDTGAVDVVTINVSGDQNLTISDALDVDVTALNATGFTGALTATLTATGTTVTGGSGGDTITAVGGDDTLNMGAGDDTVITAAVANITVADAFAGGDGTDTFKVSADATIADAFQRVKFFRRVGWFRRKCCSFGYARRQCSRVRSYDSNVY
jgi:Ca2+-binding RTX toxin-like protein